MKKKFEEKSPKLTSLSKSGGCGCKLPSDTLFDLLDSHDVSFHKNLLVGRKTSDDAAAYQLKNGQVLLSTTDFFAPIVDDPYDFGQIAATNALSDIYAMGGTPIMALAIVGMPTDVLSKNIIHDILRGGEFICAKARIPIAGGHSISSKEPIYGLSINGLVDFNHLKQNSKANPGSVLILSKGIGIGILCNAFKKGLLSMNGYSNMVQHMTQLNYLGEILGHLPGVYAMTDITGFGLLGHLLEMALGSKLTAKIEFSKVPILKDTRRFAEAGCVTSGSKKNWNSYKKSYIHLDDSLTEIDKSILSDPQTSGGLLVSCSDDIAKKVLTMFHSNGFFDAAIIGKMIKSQSNFIEVYR